MELCHSRVIKG